MAERRQEEEGRAGGGRQVRGGGGRRKGSKDRGTLAQSRWAEVEEGGRRKTPPLLGGASLESVRTELVHAPEKAESSRLTWATPGLASFRLRRLPRPPLLPPPRTVPRRLKVLAAGSPGSCERESEGRARERERERGGRPAHGMTGLVVRREGAGEATPFSPGWGGGQVRSGEVRGSCRRARGWLGCGPGAGRRLKTAFSFSCIYFLSRTERGENK